MTCNLAEKYHITIFCSLNMIDHPKVDHRKRYLARTGRMFKIFQLDHQNLFQLFIIQNKYCHENECINECINVTEINEPTHNRQNCLPNLGEKLPYCPSISVTRCLDFMSFSFHLVYFY